MKGEIPVCLKCRHFIDEKGSFKCSAFPDGIPDEIKLGGNKHTSPIPGDNGILFEKM